MHFSISARLNRHTDPLHDLPRSFILPRNLEPTLAECYKAAGFNGLNRQR
jgi:hypothetical protein